MADEKKHASAGVLPVVKPFVNVGASGMLATCVIQPIYTIKGVLALWKGTGPAVVRAMLEICECQPLIPSKLNLAFTPEKIEFFKSSESGELAMV